MNESNMVNDARRDENRKARLGGKSCLPQIKHKTKGEI